MTNKSKAPKGEKCTSTATGGALKCVLEGPHTVHSTKVAGRKGAQFSTWSLGDDNRIWVTSFTTSGKQQGKWDENPPKAPAAACIVTDQPDEEQCRNKRFGVTRCQLIDGHIGAHLSIGEDSGRVNTWSGASDEMNCWQPCGAKVEPGSCVRPEEHDGEHLALQTPGLIETLFGLKSNLDVVAMLLGRDDVAAVFAPNKNPDPSLADACPKCGFELGQHTGKKCPKAVRPARQKHDDSGVTIEVGASVRMARLANGEVGVVREVVDTKRGRRALVGWADSEQFVDLIALVVVEPTPAEPPRPVKFTDLCLKCGLAKHAGKCAKAANVGLTTPVSMGYTVRGEATTGPKILGYRRHPVAAAYPLLDGAAFEEFADLIEGSGLREDIVLVEVDGETWILDGSNRALACERRKVEPRFMFYTGPTDIESLKSYSIDKNGAGRRHLDPSIRAMIASELADLGPGKPHQRQPGRASGLTQGEAGKKLGVSDRLVRRARVVRENGTAKVKEAVMRGKLAVEAAEQVSKLPASEQDEIADEALAKKDGSAAVRTGRVRSLVKQKEKRATVRKINEGRVMPMPLGPFGVIYGDYPWLFENSDQHEGSRGHMGYPPMSLDEIIAHARETRSRAAENCILALWTTNWHIIKQMPQVLDAYGAEHRTVITWPKEKAGVGSWPRGKTEHLVIAEIGKTTHTLNEVTTLLESYALREHSRKPDEVAELLLKHCSGPHLELFAREPRSGWIAWGAETKKFAAEAA